MPSTTAVSDPRVQQLSELRDLAASPSSIGDDAFVRTLALAREVFELSDRKLADELRVSRPTVNRWINNRHLPHPAMRVPILAWIADEAGGRLKIAGARVMRTRAQLRGTAAVG